MHPAIAKFIYLNIQNIRQEPVTKFLKEMKKNDKLSRKEIFEIQRKRIFKLLDFAYHHSPYYSELFDSLGIKVSDFYSLEDLKIIPPLTKDNLRDNLDKIRSSRYKRRYSIAKTSGSTGKVLKFIKDREATAAHNASYYRGLSWHGIDIGAKEAMLWGVPVDRIPRSKIRVLDFLLNRFREKEYNLHPEILFDFYKELKNKKPVFLSGYSTMVYQFAQFVKEENLDGKSLGLKIVKCTSETIYDDAYDLIRNTFDCPLVVEYGSAETNIVAFSCEKGGIHLFSDFVLTEFCDPRDDSIPDGYKELIITSLFNYSLPIIRYRIGDYGIPSKESCVCGRELPLIKKILGRTGSIVYGTSGQRFHSILFYYIFKGLHDQKIGGVNQFKVIQLAQNHLKIQIVKNNKFSSAVIHYLNSRIKEKLGKDLMIDYEFSVLIDREKSGKIRDFISYLD